MGEITYIWQDDEPCPRCGSYERADGDEWDFEPDGMCWTDAVCLGCGLIHRPHDEWVVDDGLNADLYVAAAEARGSQAGDGGGEG